MSKLIASNFLRCAFVVTIFAELFLIPAMRPPFPKTTWPVLYNFFHVPAFSYPGADARNIQMAAFCAKQGYSYYGTNPCLDAAAPIKSIYPEANPPVLNYPVIWPILYGLFDNYSEAFFMGFWLLNAGMLVSAFTILSVKYNSDALALFLFSPISLLAIERGNIDASAFFVTFVSLLAFGKSKIFQSISVGLASSMKVFPILTYLAFVRNRRPVVAKEVVLGSVLAAPLIIFSCWHIEAMLAGTARGFEFSYGLSSILNSSLLVNRTPMGQLIVVSFIAIFISIMIAFLKNRRFRRKLQDDLSSLNTTDLIVLLASASIFFVTFFLFTNWAYRLIFATPVFFVLCLTSSPFTNFVRASLVLLFWIPMAPWGWTASNLLCFPISLLFGVIAIGAWDVVCLKDDFRSGVPLKNATEGLARFGTGLPY